jgi:hypothetical protein
MSRATIGARHFEVSDASKESAAEPVARFACLSSTQIAPRSTQFQQPARSLHHCQRLQSVCQRHEF